MSPPHHAALQALGILLLALCMTLLPGCATGGLAQPATEPAILDLAAWNLHEPAAPIPLNTHWELYCGRLLTPADFQASPPPVPDGFQPLPSSWRTCTAAGLERGEFRHATLRLTLQPPPGVQPLALRLYYIRSAYSLWVNGARLLASGTVGASMRTESPRADVQLGEFLSTGSPVELVLQVSNQHHMEGGIPSPILLGPPGVMQSMQLRNWGVAAFFAGGLLLMGVYHLCLGLFRRKDPSPLYFGCYCLLWLTNFSCSESSWWIIRLAWPDISSILLDRVALVAFFCSVPVGYSFFRSLYLQEFSTRLHRLAIGWGALASLVAVVGPLRWLTTLLPVYYLTSSLLILYCLYCLNRARRRGREGAGFILMGFAILGPAGLNDMLFDTGIIHTGSIIHVGMFGFILFQSLALARRFSRAFTAVEQLSSELEGKNVALEEEMAERNRLVREIVDASEAERRRLSHDLHDGLCQQLTGARLHCSVLENTAPAEAHESSNTNIAALSSLLNETVREAYALSVGLWPVEHDAEAAGPSLEELARRAAERTGVHIAVTRDLPCAACSHEHLVQLYRIAQEALTNAAKHARAQHIQVSLACDGSTLAIEVRDDGQGRRGDGRNAGSPEGGAQGGLGLRILAHRARIAGGELEITDASPDAAAPGTVVACRIAGIVRGVTCDRNNKEEQA